MASTLEINALKQQWKSDPCWDIEATKGFEAHRQELYIYRLETELSEVTSELVEVADFRRRLREFIG